MGLFSGITKVVKSVAKGATSLGLGITGGDLLSGGLGLLGGIQQNSANSAEAAANRQFQAGQTGTAYQRAVTDLKAAGLNPMLAYTNGGASSGGGAQAVMQNTAASAMSNARSTAEIQNLRQTNNAIRENIKKTKADTEVSKTQAALNKLAGPRILADTAASAASARASDAAAGYSSANANLARQQFKRDMAKTGASATAMARGLSHFDRLMDSVGRLNPIAGLFGK